MNRQDRSKFITGYSKVLTQAWADPSYRDRLKQNPTHVLTEAGISVPTGTRITIKEKSGEDGDLEDQIKLWEMGTSKGMVDLYVPSQPQLGEGEVSDQQLEALAGGGNCCCTCTPCCTCT